MADTQVTFDIVARDRASRDFNRVGKAADRTGDRVRRFGRISGAVARTAGVALGGALVVVAGGLYKAAKAAGAEEQEMAVLANTLAKSTGATDAQIDATESWITTLQNATGVADGDLRPALGKLAIATGDVSRAQDILKTALDISAARGQSLNTVVTALGKGAMGQTEGLARLGIATRDAGGEMLSFDQILKSAADTMGGAAAAAADTTAGRVRIMKARFADLVEEIGKRVLPIANNFLTFLLDDLFPALGDLRDWFKEKILPALKDAADYVKNTVVPRFREIAEEVLPTLRKAGKDAARAINDLRISLGLSSDAAKSSKQSMSGLTIAIRLFAALVKQASLNVRIIAGAIRLATANSRLLADGVAWLLSKLKGLASWLGSHTIPNPFKGWGLPNIPDLPGAPGIATGGTVTRSGMAWVGERGPELVKMPKGATVYDAQQSAAYARDGGTRDGGTVNGGGLTVNQNITSTDPQRAADESARQIRRVAWSAGWGVA